MAALITLYDIPTIAPRTCWSPNVWKARMALNFKKVPYKTEWIEYPDIQPFLQSRGFKPAEGADEPAWTLPAVSLADGTLIHESRNIANYLEEAYPEPPLHVDDPIYARVLEINKGLRPVFLGGVIPRLVARNDLGKDSLLSKESEEFYIRTRWDWFSCSLADYENKSMTEESWVGAKVSMEKLSALLKENEGPFLLGKEISYADMMLHGLLIWTNIANPEVFGRLMSYGGKELEAHFEACKPWTERNDH